MKRFLLFISIIAILMSGCMMTRQKAKPQEEVRGIWFSFFDWNELPREEIEFRKEVSKVIDNLKKEHLNTLFLHVHSHSDSYYNNSTYFPFSQYASGTSGKKLNFDPLEIFIQIAHEKNIKLHAWYNPYRIGTSTQYANIPNNCILDDWKNNEEKQRNILLHRGQYYLNPSKQDVQDLIVNSIIELCQNYDIDGVHFDDYFYPAIDDFDESLSFDKKEYEESFLDIDIESWRKNNVSSLIKRVHEEVKNVESTLEFGVSPSGNIPRLTGNQQYLVDLDRWLNSDEYLDYIIPQIYWGFEPRLGNGNVAPWAFDTCLSSWLNAVQNSPVKLYIGLALYRAGNDEKDGNEVSEWLRFDDIISRQIERCYEEQRVGGFVLFDYRDLIAPHSQKEINNLQRISKMQNLGSIH